MADIRIVVVYGDELEYLQVDGMELDVSAIQDKPIRDCSAIPMGGMAGRA